MKHYIHPFLDSKRWSHYKPRNDDIIIATPFKSGTTWMQMIVMNLLYVGREVPLLRDVGHWVDLRLEPIEGMKDRLEKQSERRFIKTHLPADANQIYENVKYIVVDRDPRDVFMSLWNHYKNLNLEPVNSNLPEGVQPIPKCPDDILEFWNDWLTKGYFSWEDEGFPFWSNLRHVQSWFDLSSNNNVLHIHYSDLLENPECEIEKIAEHLDIQVSYTELNKIVEQTSFKYTKDNLEVLFPNSYKLFNDGANTFFNKGVNNQWNDVLGVNELALFSTVTSKMLSKACQKWLIR